MPGGRGVPTLIAPRRALSRGERGREGDRGKRSGWGGGCAGGGGREWGAWRPLSYPAGTSAGKSPGKGIEGGGQPTHCPASLGGGGQLTHPICRTGELPSRQGKWSGRGGYGVTREDQAIEDSGTH